MPVREINAVRVAAQRDAYHPQEAPAPQVEVGLVGERRVHAVAQRQPRLLLRGARLHLREPPLAQRVALAPHVAGLAREVERQHGEQRVRRGVRSTRRAS